MQLCGEDIERREQRETNYEVPTVSNLPIDRYLSRHHSSDRWFCQAESFPYRKIEGFLLNWRVNTKSSSEMRLLTVLLGAAFVPSKDWHILSLISSRVSSLTPIYASFQEPKSTQSQSVNQKKSAMKLLLPLSFILSTLGVVKPVRAESRAASLASPAEFSYPELREVIQEGKVFVIKDFIDKETIQGLRRDINDLVDAKLFAPSGLSNRAKGRFGISHFLSPSCFHHLPLSMYPCMPIYFSLSFSFTRSLFPCVYEAIYVHISTSMTTSSSLLIFPL